MVNRRFRKFLYDTSANFAATIAAAFVLFTIAVSSGAFEANSRLYIVSLIMAGTFLLAVTYMVLRFGYLSARVNRGESRMKAMIKTALAGIALGIGLVWFGWTVTLAEGYPVARALGIFTGILIGAWMLRGVFRDARKEHVERRDMLKSSDQSSAEWGLYM